MEITFPAQGVLRLPPHKQIPVVTDDGTVVGRVVHIEAYSTFSEVHVRVDDLAVRRAVQEHIELMRPVLHIFLPDSNPLDGIFNF